MKRALIPLIAIIAFAGAGMYGYNRTAQNPDPNHTHADFAVWINGEQFDFAKEEFMSHVPVASVPSSFRLIPAVSAHEGEEEGGSGAVVAGREYLHLHDMNGHVIHRHKPGLTFGDFLESIGFTLDEKYTDDDLSVSCVTTPDGDTYCDETESQKGWLALVNNAVVGCKATIDGNSSCGGPDEPPFQGKPDIIALWNYDFKDGDKILLSYGPYFEVGEEGVTPHTNTMKKEWALLTNDACMYSKTCPGRGTPPTENCIADPTVPCIVQ
ncbi:hypothetical protein K8942_04060 [Candidatus Peribacteria bacterium]|nr:MAG: hypothetical protein K8942_04060 [Candidatus Peribacteria bacterium]